jgi:hypothetical protein
MITVIYVMKNVVFCVKFDCKKTVPRINKDTKYAKKDLDLQIGTLFVSLTEGMKYIQNEMFS